MERELSVSGVKYLVGKTAAVNALVAGFVATHIATVFGIWFGAAKLPQFDFNTLNGYIALGFMRPPEITFLVGALIHYTDGILFGLIFGLVLYPMMGQLAKPLAPMKPTTNLLKGLIFGWMLWIISSALWMPLLVGPLFSGVGGVGPFLTYFTVGVGYQAVFTNLFWHTLYGVNLGLLFSPMRTTTSWSPR
jgi:hypothetical protein